LPSGNSTAGHRLVGILHGCLETGTFYSEQTAWKHILSPAS